MFTDSITLDLGGETVKVRRLTIAEIREDRELLRTSADPLAFDEHRERLIRDHVTMADGSPLDVGRLSIPQMRKLVTNLVGLPDEGGLTDFIGLLC